MAPASFGAPQRTPSGAVGAKSQTPLELRNMYIRTKLLTATAAASLTLSLAAVGAGAQGVPVGTPGEPQCHGERVSTGNRRVEDILIPPLGVDLEDYRLTPPNRAALLE